MTGKRTPRASPRILRALGAHLPELRPLGRANLCRHDDIVVECVCVIASHDRPVAWPTRHVVIPLASAFGGQDRLAWPNGAPSRGVTPAEVESPDALAAIVAEVRRQFELDRPVTGLAARSLERLDFPWERGIDGAVFGRSVLALVLGRGAADEGLAELRRRLAIAPNPHLPSMVASLERLRAIGMEEGELGLRRRARDAVTDYLARGGR